MRITLFFSVGDHHYSCSKLGYILKGDYLKLVYLNNYLGSFIMKNAMKLSSVVFAATIFLSSSLALANNPITKNQCPTSNMMKSIYSSPSLLHAFDDEDNQTLLAVSTPNGTIQIGNNKFTLVVFEDKALGQNGAVSQAIKDVNAINSNYPIVISFINQGENVTVCSYSQNFSTDNAHSIGAVFNGHA